MKAERGAAPLTVEELAPEELGSLLSLFDYRDPKEMLAENTRAILSGEISVFVLREGEHLLGELRVRRRSPDPRFASEGRRAYLYAFRIREEAQGQGLGTRLLGAVLSSLAREGYREFTVGVEDENQAARRLYERHGFTEPLARIEESYQGDRYEYTLLLRA
jgi:ribosomal protein S18 acetylase RimI-like enzyme